MFPVMTEEDWRAAVRRSGATRESHSYSSDGIPVGPLYQRQHCAPILGHRQSHDWVIVQRLIARTEAAAVAEVGEDLAGGANGIEIACAASVHPLATPLHADKARGLVEAVGRSMGERCALRIDAGPATPAIASGLLEVTLRKQITLTSAFDPLSAMAVRGGAATDACADLARLAADFESAGIDGEAVIADGRIWHAGGASEVQELAATLSSVVQHLRMLGGIPADRALHRIGVALAADADQLLTTAKFRAMRVLLERLAEVVGAEASDIRIHAETAWRIVSRLEPRSNILRAAGAAFAAATGGADSLTVLPFDVLDGASSAGRRLARNTQIILAEESHLARFADPGAGSGAIEALTDALAEAAWDRFQRIEAEGGMLAAIGTLTREVAATRNARLARVRSGEDRIVGVNAFAETPVMNAGMAMAPAATDRLVFVRPAEALEPGRQ